MPLSGWILVVALGVLALPAIPSRAEPTGRSFLDFSILLETENASVSELCREKTGVLYTNLQNLTLWAFEMWDASAKQPAGVLQAATHQLGNFDECVGGTAGEGGGVARQYCLLDVTVRVPRPERPVPYPRPYDSSGSALLKIYNGGEPARLRRDLLRWAVCAPAACSPRDLRRLVTRHLEGLRPTPGMRYEAALRPGACQPPRPSAPLPPLAQAFCWIVGAAAALSLAVACYHAHLERKRGNDVPLPPLVRACSGLAHLRGLPLRSGKGLDVLYGVRFLSICFVIMDHRIATSISGPLLDGEFIEQKYRSFESVFICHGDLLVDSFFALSGLLAARGLLGGGEERPFRAGLALLVRYVRLAPAYALVVLWTAGVLPLTGDGPLWSEVVEVEAARCRRNWWTNLLMISNYVREDEMCMVHSWYIPCDFHFFAVALGACRVLRAPRRAARGLTGLVLLLAASMLVPALITYCSRLPATLLFYNDFLANPPAHRVFRLVYIKSHARLAPYVLGLLAGYVLHRHARDRPRLSPAVSGSGALLALGLMLASMASGTVFYEAARPYSAAEAALFAALHRPAWAFAVCLLVLCCALGDVPALSSFLGWSPWVALSKLAYGAYLLHMGLQQRAVGARRAPLHLDYYALMVLSAGDVVAALLGALLLYVTVEAPLKDLLVLLLRPRAGSPPPAEGRYASTGLNNEAADSEEAIASAPASDKNVNVFTSIAEDKLAR